VREICYQREMREREAARDPRPRDTVINYTIEEIGADEAKEFILRYEWLGTVGRPLARYGARNPQGELAAVALFGTLGATNAANLFGEAPGLFREDDYRKNSEKHIIALERGACAHWAHPHTASWFIPRVCRRAAQDKGWKVFFAYSDMQAGEIGTVYQACNWSYIGQSPDRLVDGKPRDRWYFPRRDWPESRWISDHAFFGHRGLTMANVMSGEWVREFRPAKHKYVHIEGTWCEGRGPKRSERRALRRLLSLKKPSLEYPKRASIVIAHELCESHSAAKGNENG
jgi:hypothetical protein